MDNESSLQADLQEEVATHSPERAAVDLAASVVATELTKPATCGLSEDARNAVVEILIAVMWSDGELLENEVTRGRAAAEVLDIRPRGGGAFAAIADGPLPFPQLGFEHLTPATTPAVYAAAEWISLANDQPSQRRAGFLRALRTRMRITDAEGARLQDLAMSIDAMHAEPHEALQALIAAAYRSRPVS